MKYLVKTFMAAAFACSVMHASPSMVQASDHVDAPNLSDPSVTGQQDINDLYAFQTTNAANSALILTVNPFATTSSTFATDTAYRFEIDTTGDGLSNSRIEATFGDAVGGVQSFSLTQDGVNLFAPTTVATTGANAAAANGGFALAGGGTAIASTFDDPFFFDLVGFQNTVNPDSDETFTGDDFFAGLNVSAIVLELPSAQLIGDSSNIGVWATTVQDGVGQVDRVGRPAINTVLLDTDSKQAFNEASPDADFNTFGAEVSENIAGLSDQANADALTPILLPDILTFDTADSGGFLNGRRLDDDVIDAELGLLTGGDIPGDGVDANDFQFNSVFPFLAPATVAAVPEPSSALVIAVAFGTCLSRRRRKS